MIFRDEECDLERNSNVESRLLGARERRLPVRLAEVDLGSQMRETNRTEAMNLTCAVRLTMRGDVQADLGNRADIATHAHGAARFRCSCRAR